MRSLLTLVLLAIGILASMDTVFAYPHLLPQNLLKQNEFRAAIGGSYYQTRHNLDSAGDSQALPNGGRVASLGAQLHAQYGLLQQITLFGNIGYVRNQIENSRFTIENAGGPSEGELGLRMGFHDLPVRLFADLSAQIPLYSRPGGTQWATLNGSSSPPQGTGATDLRASATIEVPLTENFFLGGSMGYTRRSAGFSDLIIGSAYGLYQKPRGPFVRVGILGQTSALEDQFTGRVVNDRAASLLAGSLIYNSINPSFAKADLLLGTYVSADSFVSIGSQYEVAGNNTSRAPLVFAALGVHFGGKTSDSGYSASNKGFQTYYFSAKVVQVNSALNLILIDKGKSDGVVADEYLDLFEPDKNDGTFGETIARAKVAEVGPTRTKLKVLEYYKEAFLQEGIIVRRPVR